MAAALCLTLLPVGVLAEDSTTEPQLFVQYLYYNTEGLLTEDTGASLQNSRELPMDSMFHAFFYYGTSEADFVKVPADSLRAKNTCITVEEIAAKELADRELARYAVAVRPNAFGSSGVIYTDTDSVEHEFPMTVTLPWLGFYSANERTEANYLGNDLSFTGSTTDANGDAYETVYILPEDGWTITGINTDPDNEGQNMSFFSWETVTDASGNKAVLVSISDRFEADNWYNIMVTAENGNGSTWDCWCGFSIADNRPGLRFRHVDNDENDNYFVEDELNSELNGRIENNYWIAVYYINGDDETLIPLEDLNIPGITKAELLTENNQYYFRLRLQQIGSGEITCDTYPGTSIPVTVDLPRAAFYSSTNRSGDTYLGESLPFTGLNTDASGKASETVYILPEDGWIFTDLTLDPSNDGYDMSFFDYVIAADGSYVEVTLTEGFASFEYGVKVFMQRTNGNSSSNPNLWFKIQDNRPGLRFKHVDRDENDNFFVEDELNSSLDREINNGDWIAVYYINGSEETPIPLSALSLPSIVDAWLLDESNPYFIQLSYEDFGSGKIICNSYPGCSIPVTVSRPALGFYNSETRSESTYAGETLKYTGASDQYYLLWDEGLTITGIDTDPDNKGQDMPFFSWETVTAANGKKVVLVSINDGFEEGRWYNIEVSAESSNGGTWRRWCGFNISDARPGLKYRYVDNDSNDNYFVEDELNNKLNGAIDNSHWIAVYYVDGTNETLIPLADLNIPAVTTAELLTESNPNYFRLRLTSIGSGEITYTAEDGTTYSLPVTVSLPEVGFYSTPTRSEETYLNGMLTALPGETAVGYLIWDPQEIENIDDVLVTLTYGNNWDCLLDEVSLGDAEETLADCGIKLTLYKEKGYLKIESDVDTQKTLNLILKQGRGNYGAWVEINNSLIAKIHGWFSDREHPTITYNGEKYTFGIGRIEDGGKFDMFDAGQGFGATSSIVGKLHETVYLGAMVNFNTKEEEAAPSWLYNCISDVSFEIVDYINAHDLNDQAKSNVYIADTYPSQINGCNMATAELETVPGGFVEALLRVTFTVTMPGEEPVECSVQNVVHYAYNMLLYPDMREIDTAGELNSILSSYSAFVSWIRDQDEENGTDLYQQYMSNQSLNWEATFVLQLPAVTYDDIIEVNLDGIEFEIEGTTDASGKTTTMPGMWLHKNTYFFLSDINFEAVPGITQEYAGEVFTCGILANSEQIHDGLGDVYTVHGCTFTGFDYGVRNTPYGYVCVGGRNYFRDCNVAYLIDCAGKTGGNANDTTYNTIFENCKTAVMILGLPEYITPYDYRILYCDFINNEVDFNVQAAGKFYFYRNFYGTMGTVMTDVNPAVPTIKEGADTIVCTNPRYAFPLLVMGDTSSFNYLYLDTGFTTYIPNKEASTLAVDVEQLEEDLATTDDAVTINVLGDDEEVQGTWTFNGTEE